MVPRRWLRTASPTNRIESANDHEKENSPARVEPADGDKLERHPVREQEIKERRGEHRQGEVEVQGREPCVPVHAPSKDATRWEEILKEHFRQQHVGTHVPTRGRVGNEEVRETPHRERTIPEWPEDS